MKFNSTTWMFQGPVAAILLIATASSASAAPASDWRSRVSPDLLAVYDSATAPIRPSIKATVPPGSVIERSTARFDAQGRVQVDVNFDCANAAPTLALETAGLVVGTTVKAPPMCVVEGWAASAALPALASVPGAKVVELPHYAKTPAPIKPSSHANTQNLAMSQGVSANPAIDANGVTIMEADKYIAQTGVTGSGITVGVINQGADSMSVIQARGELPQVNVVQPSANPTPPAGFDEGTVMLEEVYAVAPGANLAFCGPQTYVQYIACVQSLIAANVTVVTDDLLFWGMDVMSAPAQNAASQAIENILVANPGVMLFSSAENNAKNYWQGPYTPIAIGAGSFTCQGQTDFYFEKFTSTSAANVWTLGGASASDLLLAWANVGGVSTANYDLYILDSALNMVTCAKGSGSTAISGSTTYDIIQSASLSSPNTYVILIGTPDTSLSGKFLKLIGLGDNADTWSSVTSGSTISPQVFAAGVVTIGAVDGGDGIGANIEAFSATGPIQFSSGATLQSPVLVAPDDIYVDNVGTSFSNSMFSGTSAASPNAAAVAALIRSAFPSLTPSQVNGYLQAGATPLGGSAPNGTFGYGRVDALGALAQIPAPTISGLQGTTIVGGSSSQPLPLTIGGIGTLKVNVTAAIFNAVVAPANCGSSSGTCTLTLTPPIGALGTATVQVTVTDGANRSSSTQFAVTITKPAPPTIMITSGGTQSVTVNGAIAPVAFTLSGTGTLTVTPNTTDVSSITISSGCGTTTMNCTATLGTAQSSPGTATLTLTVEDPYVQSATASATVTENAVPAKSGGGALDPWALLGLTGLVLVQLTSAARKRE